MDKPDGEEAWRVLTELTQAVALSDCRYRPEVVRAMLRRAPVRIPATGFGFRGRGVSYQTTGALALSGFRSNDSVTIQDATGARPSELDFHHTSGEPFSPEHELLVCLRAGDWVAYDVGLAVPGRLELAVQIRAGQKGAARAANGNRPALDIMVDDERAEPKAIDDEHLIRATTSSPVAAGRHLVRIVGRGEETLLHWIEVFPSGRDRHGGSLESDGHLLDWE